MAAIEEPFQPPDNRALAYVIKLHDDNTAVLLRTHRPREYEAHELREPFSQLIKRLHCEGTGGWHGPIAHAEHRARAETEERIASLTA